VLTRLHFQRGVSLIEIMVGLVIVALLLGLGAPSFSTYIQNTHIRNAAEAIQTGLNLARAEAVRRNTNVSFVLGSGSSWTVGCTTSIGDEDDDGVDDCPAAIQTYTSAEGSSHAAVDAGTPTLEFNGLGSVTSSTLAAGHHAIFSITNPNGGSCRADGPMRCLRVIVSSAGQILMCDPDPALSSDPRACPISTPP